MGAPLDRVGPTRAKARVWRKKVVGETGERQRRALTMLSSVGAALAGVGVGAYLAEQLSPAAPIIFAIGLAAHLFGMIGTRRVVSASRYAPAEWEQVGYWLCWALVAAAIGYASLSLG